MESLVMGYRNMQNNGFWSGKRVLVTGHTGFKGSWLSLWLNMLGAEVTGYALAPLTSRDNFVLSGIVDHMRHETGDVRDFDRMKRLFESSKPEIVFHLAAQPLVREFRQDDRERDDRQVLREQGVGLGLS